MRSKALNQPEDYEFFLGHQALEQRPNICKELAKLGKNPLAGYIKALGKDTEIFVLQNDFSRFKDCYRYYYLTLERFLPAMSVAVRWSNGPYWVLRGGGKYSPAQRELAKRYNEVARYLYLDFYNFLLWARMLLDRTAALSRYFLKEKNVPSFTSFADHKKFFLKLSSDYGTHEEYAEHIRYHTPWFDTPLKLVRDRYLVHASPLHNQFFGYPAEGHELSLLITVAKGPPDKPLAKVQVISVGALQLAREIDQFLRWFGKYGSSAVSAA